MLNSTTDLCRHVMVDDECTPRSQSRHNRFPGSTALIEDNDPLDAKSRHFSPFVFGMNIGPLGQVVDMYQFFWKTHVLKCAVHDAPSYKTRAQPSCDTRCMNPPERPSASLSGTIKTLNLPSTLGILAQYIALIRSACTRRTFHV